MDTANIARFLVRMEEAMASAGTVWGQTFSVDKYCDVLNLAVEKVAADLELVLKSEGVTYPTFNEPRATARSLLWVGWISWMWTAKAERLDSDANAARVRPIVIASLNQFISAGQEIGRNGRRPEDYP